ncbi:MAG: twin-arginine translocase subunit TatB [Myxococcales bacterium]|nr:twin-arginine translocase subunit TatB [Myxococcales bacterium]
MFGIGTWELVVILVLALIVLGPEKLPDMARKIGRTVARLRRTADEVKREIDLDGIQQDLSRDDDLRSLQEDLDVRAQMRRAISELELAPPLPAAKDPETSSPAAPTAAPTLPPPSERGPDGSTSRE